MAEPSSPVIQVSTIEALFATSSMVHAGSPVDPDTDQYNSNLEAVRELMELARSGEIRDVAFSPLMLSGAFLNLLTAWAAAPVASVPTLSALPPPSSAKVSVATGSAPPESAESASAGVASAPAQHPRLEFLRLATNFLVQFSGFPEFHAAEARPCVPPSFADAIVARVMSAPAQEQAGLSATLSVLYKKVGGAVRCKLRRLIGDALCRFAAAPNSLPGIQTLLTLTSGIVRGMDLEAPTTAPIVRELVGTCLLPLHTTNAMLTEAQPLIVSYHSHLVYCIEQCIHAVPDLAIQCITAVVASWPPTRMANSPKCVCLVHELDRLLSQCVRQEDMEAAILACGDTLAAAIESEYARIPQRVMQMFESKATRETLAPQADLLVVKMLPALFRGGKPHWNKSVNKQTRALLAWLCSQSPDLFLRALPAAMRGQQVGAGAGAGASAGAGAGASTVAATATNAAAEVPSQPDPSHLSEATAATLSSSREVLSNGAEAAVAATSSSDRLELSKRAARQALLRRQEDEMLRAQGISQPIPAAAGSSSSLTSQSAVSTAIPAAKFTSVQAQPIKGQHEVTSFVRGGEERSSSSASSNTLHKQTPGASMPPPPSRPATKATGSVGNLVASGYASTAPFAKRSALSSGANPPLTVTGAAPWAGAGTTHSARTRVGVSALSSQAQTGESLSSSSSLPPPPQAAPPSAGQPIGMGAAGSGRTRRQGPTSRDLTTVVTQVESADGLALAMSKDKKDEKEEESTLPDLEGLSEEEALIAVVGAVASPTTRAGISAYLEALKPPKKSKAEEAAAAAAAAPVETEEGGLTVEPVRLEGLKLQDLVFGRVLGSGAFSTVKWCKRIVPGLSQSAWPEFATKVISSETMARLGYERSVEREVAVLRRMTHPGVARLLASFRYGDGAFLVLEYGSRGDLHSHITGMGSLSLESARFAVGEVVAGLSAVHQLGFAYGDLKPENILLTKSGHVKLTDFGGARPISDAAKAAVRAERHILRNLPDGSWKAAAASGSRSSSSSSSSSMDDGAGAGAAKAKPSTDDDEEASETEQKLELTAVYMAPELVTGSNVSVASDCWALGCVLYFALAGRPPVWADGVAELMQSIVAFSIESHFPADFPEDAKDLVTRLLSKDPADRVSEGPDPLAWVKEHPFFAPLGMPVSKLYTASPPELEKGTVAPQADARWARRQYSMLIAPMPEKFDFVAMSADSTPIPETDVESGAPFTSQSAAKAVVAPLTSGAVFAVGSAAALPASDAQRLDMIDEDDFEDATDAVE